MPSDSSSRGRGRTRSPRATARPASPSRSRSPRRSVSPRSLSRSRSPSRTSSYRGHYARRNGRERSRTRSPSRSRSRGAAVRRYRDRSFSHSPGREPVVPKSSKVHLPFRRTIVKATRHTYIPQIVVEKLTKNVTEDHLREIFGTYGTIKDIDLPINRQCKRLFSSTPPPLLHPTN